MSNYPPGFTQGQHDRAFVDAPDQDRYGNEEDCMLCHRAFVQDTFDQRFYFADDVEYYGFKNLSYSKSINPFETQGGWCCSTTCWNENCALNEDESVPVPVIHLVKGGRA
jgi:hypothetical protein